jgi:hypothetical protein
MLRSAARRVTQPSIGQIPLQCGDLTLQQGGRTGGGPGFARPLWPRGPGDEPLIPAGAAPSAGFLPAEPICVRGRCPVPRRAEGYAGRTVPEYPRESRGIIGAACSVKCGTAGRNYPQSPGNPETERAWPCSGRPAVPSRQGGGAIIPYFNAVSLASIHRGAAGPVSGHESGEAL